MLNHRFTLTFYVPDLVSAQASQLDALKFDDRNLIVPLELSWRDLGVDGELV